MDGSLLGIVSALDAYITGAIINKPLSIDSTIRGKAGGIEGNIIGSYGCAVADSGLTTSNYQIVNGVVILRGSDAVDSNFTSIAKGANLYIGELTSNNLLHSSISNSKAGFIVTTNGNSGSVSYWS